MNSKRQITRKIIQVLATLITNLNLKGFLSGTIYSGRMKSVCVPGMNCYSCPGAMGACPIGALQSTMHKVKSTVSAYVVGTIVLFGVVLGRFVCGYLCPFGLFQELLHKIPLFKKKKSPRGHNKLIYLKYVLLVVFVIILPLAVTNYGIAVPMFCKWICPVGAMEGGVLLSIQNEKIRTALGVLFSWKVIILIAVIILSIKYIRPFCKYICPLGALYGFFNKFAILRYKIIEEKCVGCRKCAVVCPMEIKTYENPNSLECIRCGKCKDACGPKAIVNANPLR